MKPIIDMHTHTFLSTCCSDESANAASYIDKAAELGIQVLGITNHCWDKIVPGASGFYQPQDVEWCLKIRDEIPEDKKGVKFYVGVESEYCGLTDTLGMTAENAVKFDYILVPNTHTHMVGFVIDEDPRLKAARAEVERRLRETFPNFSEKQITRWMDILRRPDARLLADGVDLHFVSNFMCESFVGLLNHPELNKFKDKVPTFVAHPFNAVGYSETDKDEMMSYVSDEKLADMFTLMASKGVGYDISVNNFVRDDKSERAQMFRLVEIAKSCGVKFIFGTDTHSVAGLGNAWKSAVVYKDAHLTPEDLHPMARDFVDFE